MNAVLWDAWADPGAQLFERSGRMEVTLAQWAEAYAGYTSRNAYDPANAQLTVELAQAGSAVMGEGEASIQLMDRGYQNRIGMSVWTGGLHVYRWVAGVYQDQYSVAFSPAQHRWLRFSFDGGSVSYEVSANGSSFTPIYVGPTYPWMQSVWVDLSAGSWAPQDAGSTTLWDNLNP
jgi:hypothetical protein